MPIFEQCAKCGKKKLSLFLDNGICSKCRESLAGSQNQDAFRVSDIIKPTESGYTPPVAQDGPVYVFIDVETTGLSPTKDAIVQVSAMRFFGDRAVDGLNTYVNPLRLIPVASTEIHGITDEMVKDSPVIADIKEPFLALIKDATLVGYNIEFDLKFLDHAFEGALNHREYIDVLRMARKYLSLPDYHLETVANYAEFTPADGYHNSLTDCAATAAIFFRLGFEECAERKAFDSQYVIDKGDGKNNALHIQIQKQEDSANISELDTIKTYFSAFQKICQDENILIPLRPVLTGNGFIVSPEKYEPWFFVKLSGRLKYILVSLPRPEVEQLLAGTNVVISDSPKSEGPESHCRIKLNSLDDVFSAKPVILACVKRYLL